MAMDFAFSVTELSAMQSAQDDHMMDTCTLDRYTDGGADIYGTPNPTWVSDTPIACGFNTTRVEEVLGQTMVPAAEAAIRLPLATVLNPKDRITITHRFGVAITAQSYTVVGDAERGPSGLKVGLKKVTDGS